MRQRDLLAPYKNLDDARGVAKAAIPAHLIRYFSFFTTPTPLDPPSRVKTVSTFFTSPAFTQLSQWEVLNLKSVLEFVEKDDEEDFSLMELLDIAKTVRKNIAVKLKQQPQSRFDTRCFIYAIKIEISQYESQLKQETNPTECEKISRYVDYLNESLRLLETQLNRPYQFGAARDRVLFTPCESGSPARQRFAAETLTKDLTLVESVDFASGLKFRRYANIDMISGQPIILCEVILEGTDITAPQNICLKHADPKVIDTMISAAGILYQELKHELRGPANTQSELSAECKQKFSDLYRYVASACVSERGSAAIALWVRAFTNLKFNLLFQRRNIINGFSLDVVAMTKSKENFRLLDEQAKSNNEPTPPVIDTYSVAFTLSKKVVTVALLTTGLFSDHYWLAAPSLLLLYPVLKSLWKDATDALDVHATLDLQHQFSASPSLG